MKEMKKIGIMMNRFYYISMFVLLATLSLTASAQKNQSERFTIPNTYDAQAWLSMENAGAVFLPAAGYRSGTSVYDLGTEGRYWSSTRSSGEGPQFRRFSESISIQGYYYYLNGGYNGGSVRLVQDYQ